MAGELSSGDQAAFERIVRDMEAAWNAGDGTAYAAWMAEDVDFVTIRAEHFRGREVVAAGHTAIFSTVYAGSTNRSTIESARLLRPDVALLHVSADLGVPGGPLAGQHTATFSAVLTREADGWRIASFHNTLAPDAR